MLARETSNETCNSANATEPHTSFHGQYYSLDPIKEMLNSCHKTHLGCLLSLILLLEALMLFCIVCLFCIYVIYCSNQQHNLLHVRVLIHVCRSRNTDKAVERPLKMSMLDVL